MRMRKIKGSIVRNMRVRSNEKAKPKGHQHQQNGEALFAEAFLYGRVQRRLSSVTAAVIAVLAVDVDVVAAVALVVVATAALVVVHRRR